MVVEFRVLGPVEAVDGGAFVKLGGPQQRRLLAALLTAPGEAITVDRLIEIVWPDGEAPERARRTLMTYVSRLRQAIGTHTVQTVGSGYRVSADDDVIDATRFALLVEQAGRVAPTHRIALLDEALALWHGPAFGELAEEWWARPAASRLEDLRLIAIEDRSAALLETGQADMACCELEPLVASHPTRDRTMMLYLRALAEAGRKAEALRAFRVYRVELAEETGLPPSEALVMLDRSIASGDQPAVAAVGHALRGYVLHELIGEGRTSSVYRATQPGVGRDVAVKAIKPSTADTQDFVRRFEIEAQIIAQLEHPHIVPLYDFWREPGGAYLVFRLMRGGSVGDALAVDGPWPLERVGRLVDEIGGALETGHSCGLAHGDVGTRNILLDEHGGHYLVDFGIATLVDGKPADRGGSDRDLFAFASTIWELLTGIPPVPGAGRTERAQRERPTPSLATWRSDLCADIGDVLARATASKSVDRYASVRDFVAAWHVAAGDRLAHVGDDRAPERSNPSAETNQDEQSNPYKGMRPFGEPDAADFHGRDDVVAALDDFVSKQALVAVVGPSGSGKSSVVLAGLVPSLRTRGVRVITMMPGANPVERVQTAMLAVATRPLAEGGPGEQLRGVADEHESEIVLVVDQFEEAWTMSDTSVRSEFLAVLVDPGPRVRVIVVLRADFFDRPLADPIIGPLIGDATFILPTMTLRELSEAITAPARSRGVEFEEGLAADIAADVVGRPSALPTLQFALTELYEHRPGRLITADAYHQVGGVAGAVATRAEELFAGLDAISQSEMRRLFERLVIPGEGNDDTRRRAHYGEFFDDDLSVIDLLVAQRILTMDHDPASREPTVEVAHEALLHNWPRLRSWLDEDREWLRHRHRLSQAALDWALAGSQTADLYRGGRLAIAEEMATSMGSRALSDGEAEFLAASRATADAERARADRLHRRVRRSLLAVALLLVVAVIAGSFAFVQRGRATDARDLAQSEARQASMRALLASSTGLLPTQRDLAALLAIEAHRIAPTPDTAGALLSILTTEQGFMGYQWLRDIGSIDAAEALPDGTLLLVTQDEVLHRVAAPPAEPADSPDAGVVIDSEASGDTLDLEASRDGTVLARLVRRDQGTPVLLLYDISTGRRRAAIDVADIHAASVAISPDGEYVALVDGVDGAVVVIEASSGAIVGRIDGTEPSGRPPASSSVASFGADNELYVSQADGSVRIFALPGLDEVGRMEGAAGAIPATTSLAITPDGRTLVAAGYTDPLDLSGPTIATIVAWNLETLERVWSVDDDVECFRLALIDADRTVRCVGTSGAIRTYDATNGSRIDSIDTQFGTVVELTDLADGSLLAVSKSPPAVAQWRFDGTGLNVREIASGTTPFGYDRSATLLVYRLDRPDDPFLPAELINADNGDIMDPLDGFGPTTWAGDSRLASGFLDGSIGSYDIPSHERTVFQDTELVTDPTRPAYSEATQRLLVWNQNGSNAIVDLTTGQWSTLDLPRSVPRSAAFSADGRQLLTTSVDTGLSVHDAADGHLLFGPVAGQRVVAVAPDGLVATADTEGAIRIGSIDEVSTSSPRIALNGALVQEMEFGAGSSLLAVRTVDSVRLIDVATGDIIGGPVPVSRPDPDEGMALRSDGTQLAVASETGTAIWSLDPTEWEVAACRTAGRNLTRAEWDRYVGALLDYRPTCPEYPSG